MADRYKTFKRSYTNWKEFGNARKITECTGLTYDEAVKQCDDYNNNRTPAQIRKGTMMEFTKE